MIKQPKYKLALVGDMLSLGGAERVQANLSFYFESKGIEVHQIIMNDVVTYAYAGILFNMGKLKNEKKGIINKWDRLKILRKYIKENQFDFIIDFRYKSKFFNEYIATNFIYKTPYIISVRSFNTKYYFPKNRFFAKLIYKKAYGFVVVSKAIEEKLKVKYGFKNIKTIYNPVSIESIQKQANAIKPLDYKYILGIGRMHNIKQFDHLIKAFAFTTAIDKGYKLVLIGQGNTKNDLVALTQKKGIEKNVIFLDYQENPFPYFSNAFITVLTSKNEGFPNVLIESLACGTPVVAYDCESGPNEIIINKENGLLVQNQELSQMTEAIETMLNDKSLYDHCKSNTVKSVERFEFNTIGKEWLNFLKIPANL